MCQHVDFPIQADRIPRQPQVALPRIRTSLKIEGLPRCLTIVFRMTASAVLNSIFHEISIYFISLPGNQRRLKLQHGQTAPKAPQLKAEVSPFADACRN